MYTTQTPTLTEAQRWVLAMGAITRTINEGRHDLLGGAPRGAGAGAAILHDSWKLHSSEEIRAMVAHLITPLDEVPADREEALAWDLMRATNLCEWGYDAGLLTAQEAWGLMCQAARRVQSSFRSFEELGVRYTVGYQRSFTEDEDLPIVIASMLSRRGAWHDLAWEVDLDDVPIPLEPDLEIRGGRGEPIEEIVARARAMGWDPRRTALRIGLEPGEYPMCLEVHGAVELVALGEGVLLRGPDDGPAARLTDVHSSLRFEGMEIRAGSNDDLWITLVDCTAGFVRFERCRLRGSETALDITNGDSNARFTDCDLEGFTLAIRVNGCHVQLERTELRAIADLAIEVLDGEGSSARLDGCSLSDLTDRGFVVHGRLTLNATSIRRAGGHGIVCMPGGSVLLSRCEFSEGKATAAIIKTSAERLYAVNCVFRSHALQMLQLEPTVQPTVLLGCRFEGSPGSAVNIITGAATLLRNCTFEDFGFAPVFLTGLGISHPWERSTFLEDCSIRGSKQGGIYAVDGAAVTITDVRISECELTGIELKGGRLQAQFSQIDRSGTHAVYLHEGSFAWLTDCVIGSAEEAILQVGESSVRLDRTTLRRGPRAFILERSRLEATDLLVEDTTEHVAAVLSDGSIARFHGGTFRERTGVALRAQLDSSVALIGVRFDDGGVQIDTSRALFEDCTLSGCRGPQLLAKGGSYVAIQGGELRDSGEALLQVTEGSRVRARNTRFRQSTGPIGILAEDKGEVLLLGGSLACSGAHSLDVCATAAILFHGLEIDAESAECAVAPEGRLQELTDAYDATVEPAWQQLESLRTSEIVTPPVFETQADENEDEDDDDEDDDEDEDEDEDDEDDDGSMH